MSGGEALRRGASGSAVRALCVLVHGRGQSPEEMESHILQRLPHAGVALALPRAPRGAWYDARAIDPLGDTTRQQLGDALDQLSVDIMELRTDYPDLPLLLAGFSQGACLSIEYVCRGDAPPEALVAFTGCRVGTINCARPHQAPRGMPAYLSGSDADPWIPLTAMMEAAHDLGQQGMRLRTDVFPGRGHEALDQEVDMLGDMLARLGTGEPLLGGRHVPLHA